MAKNHTIQLGAKIENSEDFNKHVEYLRETNQLFDADGNYNQDKIMNFIAEIGLYNETTGEKIGLYDLDLKQSGYKYIDTILKIK